MSGESLTQEGFSLPTPWLNLFEFVKETCPDGIVSVKFVKGVPTELIEAKPKVRFDKAPGPVKLIKL